jgi:hypothetical protein
MMLRKTDLGADTCGVWERGWWSVLRVGEYGVLGCVVCEGVWVFGVCCV